MSFWFRVSLLSVLMFTALARGSIENHPDNTCTVDLCDSAEPAQFRDEIVAVAHARQWQN